MKLLFLILAIAVSCAASYFTVSQTEKFQAIQDTRKDAQKTIIVVSANVDKVVGEIEVEDKRKDEAQSERAVAQQSDSNLKTDNKSIQNQVASLDAKLSGQDAKFNELKQILAGLKTELSEFNIDVTSPSISEDLDALAEALDVKEKVLDESIEKEEKKLSDKRAEIARYNERIQARDLRVAQNEIQARVTAVKHDWGFIVIGAGSNSGFMPDTDLLIKRDGRLIGTVKPSAIEPTQTIADIDLKSLSPGVRFQPGDEVILVKAAAN